MGRRLRAPRRVQGRVSFARVAVYGRPGCHLCEHLLEELAPLVRGRAHLEVRDVDADPSWRRELGTRIPVVEVDGRVICEHTLDRAALERALAAGPAPGRRP
jgi:hypothetical protein